MMKEQKALPASAPQHLLQSSDFQQASCLLSHNKPTGDFFLALLHAEPRSLSRPGTLPAARGSWVMAVSAELRAHAVVTGFIIRKSWGEEV